MGVGFRSHSYWSAHSVRGPEACQPAIFAPQFLRLGRNLPVDSLTSVGHPAARMSVIEKPILPHPRNVHGPAERKDHFLVSVSVELGIAQKIQNGEKTK
jgi:hypothetical protein